MARSPLVSMITGASPWSISVITGAPKVSYLPVITGAHPLCTLRSAHWFICPCDLRSAHCSTFQRWRWRKCNVEPSLCVNLCEYSNMRHRFKLLHLYLVLYAITWNIDEEDKTKTPSLTFKYCVPHLRHKHLQWPSGTASLTWDRNTITDLQVLLLSPETETPSLTFRYYIPHLRQKHLQWPSGTTSLTLDKIPSLIFRYCFPHLRQKHHHWLSGTASFTWDRNTITDLQVLLPSPETGTLPLTFRYCLPHLRRNTTTDLQVLLSSS